MEAWNHNAHYHPVVLAAIPPGCRRALDVGCGTGLLTRRLRARVPSVTGVDRDEASIAAARSHPGAGDIDYRQGDVLRVDLEPASFDLVTAVASLHHMDARAGLQRMAALLAPGGVLAVVGLARRNSPLDLARFDVPAVVANRYLLLRHRPAVRLDRASPQAPIVWPPAETYRQVRRLAGELLPGVRFRRHLLWRYSLVWVRPTVDV